MSWTLKLTDFAVTEDIWLPKQYVYRPALAASMICVALDSRAPLLIT